MARDGTLPKINCGECPADFIGAARQAKAAPNKMHSFQNKNHRQFCNVGLQRAKRVGTRNDQSGAGQAASVLDKGRQKTVTVRSLLRSKQLIQGTTAKSVLTPPLKNAAPSLACLVLN
jgi:hypothetical protein